MDDRKTCRRCGLFMPVGDEGICDTCLKVGTCWHCGGLVVEENDYVFVGSLVYHRGCAQRLRNDLDAVLR